MSNINRLGALGAVAPLSFEEDRTNTENLRGIIQEELRRIVGELNAPSPLKEAIAYSLIPPGKCIRPIVVVGTALDLGVSIEHTITAATTLELIHVATLIHDDLPPLDNDDYRRGRQSCHKAFGEATAILAGDFLVPHALTLLADLNYTDEKRRALIETIGLAFLDVCRGQQLDLLSKKPEDLLRLHELKTGALFKAALLMAGVIGGVGEETLKKLGPLGITLGIGFQLVDDYLDVFGTETERGRQGSSDVRNNKCTYFLGDDAQKREGFLLLHSQRKQVEQGILELESQLGKSFTHLRAIAEEIFGRLRDSYEK